MRTLSPKGQNADQQHGPPNGRIQQTNMPDRRCKRGSHGLITQSMEDDIKPHIDRYGFTVSQALHNAGCHEDLNKALSICSTVDMLCQTSQITIRDFFTAISKYAPLAYNPLRYLTMDKMLHFARELTEVLTPKEIHVNLNELPEIANAFQAIANNMLRAEVFEKAFESCEK